jgi:hypothetical protein
MTHKNFHEAKQDTTCSLCGHWIRRGETIVKGRHGNQTCRDCIGQDAHKRDAERGEARMAAERMARSPHEEGR